MSRPNWFRKVHVPLTIVCGAPGAGKSTYVRTHAGPQDLVVCFDRIATRLFGRPSTLRPQASLSREDVQHVLRARNDMLADLMRASAKGRWPRAWLILSEPVAANRQWWADTLKARVVVLVVPAGECLCRIAQDAAAGDERGAGAQQFVREWWAQYGPARCDVTIIESAQFAPRPSEQSEARGGPNV
jgi:hypothetical protein